MAVINSRSRGFRPELKHGGILLLFVIYTNLLLLVSAMFSHIGGISEKTKELASCANVSLPLLGGWNQQINICYVTINSTQLFLHPSLHINCFSTKAKSPQASLKTFFFCKTEEFFFAPPQDVVVSNHHF